MPGFGEAATAASYCKNFIDPHSRGFPGHSSEKSDEAKAHEAKTAGVA